jgi:hypothetical protein
VETGERAEPGAHLAWREVGGGLTDDLALATVMGVALGEAAPQLLGNRARAQEEEIVARPQPVRHRLDEPAKMLDAMGLARGLRVPAAALADRRIVPNVPGGAMVGGDVRLDPLEADLVLLETGDERLPRVDPDQARVATRGGGRRDRPVPAPDGRRHQRAQAGPLSVASARSA